MQKGNRVTRGMLMMAAAAGLAGLSGAVSPARGAASDTAPMMSYLGLPQLISQYGSSLAKGDNVPVSIVESNRYPLTSDGRFAGKTMTRTSVFSTMDVNSNDHATLVAARFFGNDTGFSQRSVVPNVQNIWMYTYSEFNGSYLKDPGSPPPYGSPNHSRVSSHAYGDTDASLGDITRLDYLVQRDDFLHVVDTRQFSTQGNSMNSVVVAPAGGTGTLTSAVGAGTPYIAGRTSPNVTGPLGGSGSDSIGQVAGVVTLLMSRGKTTTSHHNYTTPATSGMATTYNGSNFAITPIAGYTVNSGDTAEVVKAALMAGAHRNVATYVNGAVTVPGITDYRANVAHQSANGLDSRYGAGMVNAYNSYRIVDAGEQDSLEDGGLGQGTHIKQYGFDYDPAFGGAAATNNTAIYGFTADGSGKFFATLAWNLKIAGVGGFGNFDSTATLYDLDLKLVDLTAGNSIVQSSASTVDNTENLWTDLVAGHSYHLLVTTKGSAFNWDYGLAWRSDVPLSAVPEPATLSILALGGLMLARRRR